MSDYHYNKSIQNIRRAIVTLAKQRFLKECFQNSVAAVNAVNMDLMGEMCQWLRAELDYQELHSKEWHEE